MIKLLYQNYVLPCEVALSSGDYATCQDYWDSVADDLRAESYTVSLFWAVLIASTMVGNVLLSYGFDTAAARMNKRIRDAIFTSLMKQDITYYDTHSISNLSTQIEDDAAMIQSFSGEPIRTFAMTGASVFVGIIISFIYMWPLALMTFGLLPLLSFGAYMEMKTYMGEDEGAEALAEGENSAGSIIVETLLSIRTVASLAMEQMRFNEYTQAMKLEDPDAMKTNILKGFATGLGFFIQIVSMGFLFWWGSWILTNYPDQFNKDGKGFENLNISLFALLFSLSGMSVAAMGLTDQAKAKVAAQRIFALIDKKCEINSLSDEGKKQI
mmetsp:Transcript_3900/g.5897  ORF Transcript_3900/g.5897 Transcript_3900/m.5897 type:complete len:326 (+) Transcript_3900:76-1053(+)